MKHAPFPSAPERFRLGVLNDAGGAFCAAFRASGRLEHLSCALELWQQAVAAATPDAPDLPRCLFNLGIGLHERFGRTENVADLEEAIRVWRCAVEATPLDSPDLPVRLINLGVGLSDWFNRTACVLFERCLVRCQTYDLR